MSNHQLANIPIVKCKRTKGKTVWTFSLESFNYTTNKRDSDNNSRNSIRYEPFFLDDISMTFSNIPLIYTCNDEIIAKNIRTGREFKISKQLTSICPYAPK